MENWVNVFISNELHDIHNFLQHKNIAKLTERLENGEKPVLTFDIDGTLIEGGLEVGPKQHKTVKEYIENNFETVKNFQKNIKILRRYLDAQVVICTGRGRIFSEMIAREIFDNQVDKIICEGGAMTKEWDEIRVLSTIEENNKILKNLEWKLKDFVINSLGGTFEEGKEICLSFNPPLGENIADFRKKIEKFLQENNINLASEIHVTNSDSAVDVIPFGVDKMQALKNELQGKVIVYFGDAKNDQTAMQGISDINIAPSNANEELKNEIVKRSGDAFASLGIIANKQEIWGVNDSLEYLKEVAREVNMGRKIKIVQEKIGKAILNDPMEMHLNEMIRENPNLQDKIFLIADEITQQSDGSIVLRIKSDSIVRLNDKIPWDDYPTVPELRKKERLGTLFSGVAAIELKTKKGKKIPVLQRDAGAPVDAGKYTLPAGRADKIINNVTNEELLEEMVFFWYKDGKIYQIVPVVETEISIEHAKKLAKVAQTKYLQTLLKNWWDFEEIKRLFTAEMICVPIFIKNNGVNIISHYEKQQYESSGFFPFYDKDVNTWEMIRGFEMDVSDFDDVFIGDGDGFGRKTKMLSVEEVEWLSDDEKVASLQAAIRLGALK